MLALIDYLPSFMQQFKEIQVIMDTSQPFVDNINFETEKFLKDLFILETSETGVFHYENMLNISLKLTDNLEDRRYKIFLKYNETLPYTYKKLVELLNSICGESNYEIYMSSEDLTLTLKLSLKIKNVLESVQSTLESIVPVNISLEISLIYTIWETLKPYFWEEFSNITWDNLWEEDLSEKLPLYTIWETLKSYFWGELFNIEWNDLKESDLNETNK